MGVIFNPLLGTGLDFTGASLPINLETDVTGVLPEANGGTGDAVPFTAGSVVFADGTKLTQDNANLFFDDTNNRLGVGTNTPSNDLSLGGNAARTIAMERSSSADTGSGLTISAGSAKSDATNSDAGSLTLATGISTGETTDPSSYYGSTIKLKTSYPGSSGTSDGSLTTGLEVGHYGDVFMGTKANGGVGNQLMWNSVDGGFLGIGFDGIINFPGSPITLSGDSMSTSNSIVTIGVSRPINVTYTFTVTTASATAGAVYTEGNSTFTITSTISGGTTLVAAGLGSPSDSPPRTLTKVSGTGDATIVYSAYTTAAAGRPLTLRGGSPSVNSSNQNGGRLNLLAGRGTGSGSSDIFMSTFRPSGTPSADGGPLTTALIIDNKQNVRITDNSGTALATSATDGFLYIPATSGTPTGVPSVNNNRNSAIAVDSTNSRLHFYTNAWNKAVNAATTLSGTGAVTFLNSSGALAADNTKLHWDDTNFRLGLGNTSPSADMHITNARDGFVGLIAESTGGGSSARGAVQVTNNIGEAGRITLTGNGNSIPNVFSVASTSGVASMLVGTEGTGKLRLQTNGADRVTIDSGGKVGIGTSTPSADLSFGETSDRTIKVEEKTTDVAGAKLIISAGNAANGTGVDRLGGTLELHAGLSTGVNNSVIQMYTSDSGGGGTTQNTESLRLSIDEIGVIVGNRASLLSTSATKGFLYAPATNGIPTGFASSVTGSAPVVIDSTNNAMYFYTNGGWHNTSNNVSGRYVTTFNATTDWGSPSGGFYTITIPAATHGRGNDPLVNVMDFVTGSYRGIGFAYEINGSSDILLKVADSPDGRFAGKVVVI